MAAKATILIVDREKILADLLAHVLKSSETSAVGVTETEHAQRLAETYPPDLVILDPAVSGASALVAALRQRDPALRFLALVNTPQGHEQARDLGIAASIDKQDGLETFQGAVRKALDVHLPGLHVLVADDEVDIRDAITQFLQDRGCFVTAVKNGSEATERIADDPSIDIVLMDIRMPNMDGIVALDFIMARDPHPSVIMMTAIGDRDVAHQALKAGASDYIQKPFDFAAMETSIVACIGNSKYRKRPWWNREPSR